MAEAIDLFARLISAFEAKAVHDTELMALSVRQLLYLEMVTQMAGGPTFSDLAERLGVSRPSVTAIVGKLIQKGLLQKEQSREDKRVYHIIPTKKGKELAELHTGHHRRIAHHFMQVLDEREIAELVQLLRKVLAKVGN